jgi:polysaccharide export outer membrane protein
MLGGPCEAVQIRNVRFVAMTFDGSFIVAQINPMIRMPRLLTFKRSIGLLMLSMSLANVGCQSGSYDATSLPAQFVPPPVVDVQTLNLSRLAASSFRGEQVGAGDTLKMQVVTGAEKDDAKTWPLTVQRDGSVEVPLVGTVSLAGLDLDSARQKITAASVERGIYRRPTISLDVEKRRSNHVTVVGAVEDPGTYRLPVAGSDLLAALVEAGGLSEDADTVVEIRRAGTTKSAGLVPTKQAAPDDAVIAQVGYEESVTGSTQPAVFDPTGSISIDLVGATQRPIPSAFQLGDGDVVTVRRRAPRYIQVIGLVKRPDRIRIPPGQNPTVLDAIAMAGGVSETIANQVLIVRKVPGQTEPVTIGVSISEAKQSAAGNPILADGDVVSVEETPVTFVVAAMKSLIRIGVNSATF